MKTFLLLLLNVAFTTILTAQTSVKISDLKSLNNSSWQGTLKYINYGDGEEVTLRTRMQIEIKGDKILMHTQFTDEPNANSKSSIKLRKRGTYFGEEKIEERTNLKDGTLKILTTFKGSDNNKPATLFKTYLVGTTEFSITKKVQFEETGKEIIRNKYSYKRILP